MVPSSPALIPDLDRPRYFEGLNKLRTHAFLREVFRSKRGNPHNISDRRAESKKVLEDFQIGKKPDMHLRSREKLK
jgi:hypothetical protein